MMNQVDRRFILSIKIPVPERFFQETDLWVINLIQLVTEKIQILVSIHQPTRKEVKWSIKNPHQSNFKPHLPPFLKVNSHTSKVLFIVRQVHFSKVQMKFTLKSNYNGNKTLQLIIICYCSIKNTCFKY